MTAYGFSGVGGGTTFLRRLCPSPQGVRVGHGLCRTGPKIVMINPRYRDLRSFRHDTRGNAAISNHSGQAAAGMLAEIVTVQLFL